VILDRGISWSAGVVCVVISFESNRCVGCVGSVEASSCLLPWPEVALFAVGGRAALEGRSDAGSLRLIGRLK
jgi:hypothetical protein